MYVATFGICFNHEYYALVLLSSRATELVTRRDTRKGCRLDSMRGSEKEKRKEKPWGFFKHK